jgi:hypothetical protein
MTALKKGIQDGGTLVFRAEVGTSNHRATLFFACPLNCHILKGCGPISSVTYVLLRKAAAHRNY